MDKEKFKSSIDKIDAFIMAMVLLSIPISIILGFCILLGF